MKKTPKVTVYITCHNYGKYVLQAIHSVLNQNFRDYELIVINDGSTDDTDFALKHFVWDKEPNNKFEVITHEKALGLTVCANKAIELSKGEYIMRLDADDYLDPNALLNLSNYLDLNPDVGLVYSDYWETTEDGEILNHVRRKNVNDEVFLLDLPAHGACTMIRKSVLKKIGGYNEGIKCQDGYDLWIKFIQEHKSANINLPLFYYRKHNKSLTSNNQKILDQRRLIKKAFFEKKFKDKELNILAIIPVRSSDKLIHETGIEGRKTSLDFTISEAKKSKLFKDVLVITKDRLVTQYLQENGVSVLNRPQKLESHNSPIENTVLYALKEFENLEYQNPIDYIMLLSANCPLRRVEHIEEAIHTLFIFNSDSVVSVTEDNGHFYYHKKFGLEPIEPKRSLKLESKHLYRENGAIFLSKVDSISKDNILGSIVSHIVMSPEESIQIDSEFEFGIIKQILNDREKNIREHG